MSYQDVRHFYEDPPDEKDLQDKEIKDTKAHLKTLTGVDIEALMEMEYGVETKSTDGLGGWSDWEEIARFVYPQHATSYARHVKSYQHEESTVDQVQIRVMHEGKEVELS
jgi:hypothetical protein